MTYSITGIGYLVGSFALGLLTYRFFQHWQRDRNIVSLLFVYFSGCYVLFLITTAITGLFFADNQTFLKTQVVASAFFQGLAGGFAGYIITYLKFRQISPWFGFSVIFLLGLIATCLASVTPYIPPSAPFLDSSGAINFGFQPPADILRFFIFSLSFFPLIYIFTQQYKRFKNPIAKSRALGLSFVCFVGLVTAIFDIILERIFQLSSITSDVVFAFFSFFVFIFILFTREEKAPEKKYTPPPSYPKIQW